MNLKNFNYLLLGVFTFILYFSHTYFDLNSIIDIIKNSGRLAPIIFILIYTFALLLMLPVLRLLLDIPSLVSGGVLKVFKK
jgi:uncharacterized membrane protein YdjX (TVP38/TMEM64 family)